MRRAATMVVVVMCVAGVREGTRAAGPAAPAAVRQMGERVWRVIFMDCNLGYFDDETCRLEAIENPFGPRVLPMSPE